MVCNICSRFSPDGFDYFCPMIECLLQWLRSDSKETREKSLSCIYNLSSVFKHNEANLSKICTPDILDRLITLSCLEDTEK